MKKCRTTGLLLEGFRTLEVPKGFLAWDHKDWRKLLLGKNKKSMG